ncbi:MAG: 2-oxo acid dehydrogenase subunit E2 [Christensenellaceae bacterium]|nr:2-oxo acid dehydrogenase subunit E2 [Christensenellaceae bacterium]
MFGFRPDGRRVKDIDPIVRITPYLMPMRCDAQVFLQHRIDYEMLARYIAKQSAQGEKITFMNIIIAAFVRAVSEHPEINRFIMNKQFFSRNNCTVSFTMLKEPQNADAGETAVKIKYDLTDTLYDVRDRMEAAVNANRGVANQNFVDKLVRILFAVPGLPTVVAALVKLLDRYGLCPGALLDELPFHTSMYITNNASIGLHHVNHHIYNFGNTSLFFGMGTIEKVATVENGTPRMKRWLPIGIVADERICSGAHYSGFFSAMNNYLNHPELLEVPPESVKFNPGCEFHVPKADKPEIPASEAVSA